MRNTAISMAIGLGAFLFLAGSASAGEPASHGEAWDDSHMLSRAARYSRPAPPTLIIGTNSYAMILGKEVANTAETSTADDATIWSQHSWKSGPKRKAQTPRSSKKFKLSGARRGRTSGSSGLQSRYVNKRRRF